MDFDAAMKQPHEEETAVKKHDPMDAEPLIRKFDEFQPGQFVQVGENCFDMIMGYAFVRARRVVVRLLNDKVVGVDDVRGLV